MIFPLSFLDITLWLAIIAIILLTTSELVVTYRKFNLTINKNRLNIVAKGVGIVLVIIIILQISILS